MNRPIMNRAEALESLLSLSPDEASAFVQRTAELAHELDDLGAGMRHALQEVVDARREGDA